MNTAAPLAEAATPASRPSPGPAVRRGFRPPKDRRVTIAIAAVVVAGIAVAWYALRPQGLPEGIASGNGRIEATDIDVATKIPGRLKEVLAREGDYVTAGQVLAQMDVATLEAQRDEAQANHKKALDAVATAEATIKMRQADAIAARAIVAQREAELDAAQRRLARSEELSKEGAETLQKLDDDRASVRAAEATLSAARAQVAAAQAAILAAETDTVGARAAVVAAAATIARITADIDDSELKAPRDARVQFRVSEPGEVLAAGGKVLNLVDLTDVYMTFFLPEAIAGRLAIGSETRIVVDAAPDWVIPATVTFVADVAQYTPKTVETAAERQKLMFRVKANIAPELLRQHIELVKTGLPGVAYVRWRNDATWPERLQPYLPELPGRPRTEG